MSVVDVSVRKVQFGRKPPPRDLGPLFQGNFRICETTDVRGVSLQCEKQRRALNEDDFVTAHVLSSYRTP